MLSNNYPLPLTIESPHIKTSSKLDYLIKTKFGHLDKLYGFIVHGSVVLRKVKDSSRKNCRMEARLQVPGTMLVALEQCGTFEAALYKLVDNLEPQLRRRKEQFS